MMMMTSWQQQHQRLGSNWPQCAQSKAILEWLLFDNLVQDGLLVDDDNLFQHGGRLDGGPIPVGITFLLSVVLGVNDAIAAAGCC